ncbi:MAG TPA: DNA topoisomerase I [Candidatus Nanoarchaeia archaeon]|nr:DNA topoisomerase I [Candidatus Nanoarchaeia archaeon]
MVELIITEKPSSAKKVAEALAEGKLDQKRSKQSSYYELTHGGKKIIVTSAVGHLYGLVEDKRNGWNYPVFDIRWESSDKSSKDLKYVKDYIDTITSLAKKCDEFTVATDYDVEGEVIGLNVVRYTCSQKDANRMKFSTLTKGDLIEAYDQKMHHLDWGQAFAGETRHKLDWFYGINLSRALTASVKAAGSFKVMSAGRVQGPALKLLVDREREIQAFTPEPYWEIYLDGDYKNHAVEAKHISDKITDKTEAERILQVVKGKKEAAVSKVSRTIRNQAPPYPFDLTTLQSESYAQFKFTPKETLEIAQSLYLAGVTSYPRTSSQKLDPKLGFKKIFTDLAKQSIYEKMCKELLKLPKLQPNDGKKTDPAHPAIYPTGLMPQALKPREQKLYDLIVKRFMATFAEPAVRETMEVILAVNKEEFIAKGTRTIKENWHVFYKPYVRLDEITLPDMKEGEQVTVKDIRKEDKETQPPNRFNQSSIIKELEKRNLGTKATRADILDRLFQRGYIEGVQIKVMKLGMETIAVLEKYAPTIVDEKLTADIEGELEKIREGKQKPEAVLGRAKDILTDLLQDFKKKEKVIGKDILQSVRETQDEQNHIGECPKCKGRLMIKFGKFGKFIACDGYPACKETFKIPSTGMIKNSEKKCEACTYPMIKVIQKGKRPQELCINPACKSKIQATKAEAKSDKKCPNCGKEMLLRKSFYGQFWGCSGFPKCKTIENIASSGMEKKPVEKSGDTSLDKAANVVSKVPVDDSSKALVDDIQKVSKKAAGKKSSLKK